MRTLPPDISALADLTIAAAAVVVGALGTSSQWCLAVGAYFFLAGAYSLKIESAYPRHHAVHLVVLVAAIFLRLLTAALCVAAAMRSFDSRDFAEAALFLCQSALAGSCLIMVLAMFPMLGRPDREITVLALALPSRDPHPGD